MKTIGKMLLSKVLTVVVVVAVLAIGFLWFKNGIFGLFDGVTKEQYSFVIKRFEKESQLVVAGADVETTANPVFENKALESWPNWTKPITKVLIGRESTVELPIKTEFKLELEGLGEEDITISDNVLTFNKPLTVYVDSQTDGEIKIKSAKSGVVDKVVDAFTASKKAQEFLAKESKKAIYKTSEHVLNDEERQEKVAKFAGESLENLINLGAEKELDVQVDVDDLVFKIQDKK